jgi:hypothetical protein
MISSRSKNAKARPFADISCPFRAPLSHGRAWNAHSYRTSGRIEISSLNVWVNPMVQLANVVANPDRSPLKSTI